MISCLDSDHEVLRVESCGAKLIALSGLMPSHRCRRVCLEALVDGAPRFLPTFGAREDTAPRFWLFLGALEDEAPRFRLFLGTLADEAPDFLCSMNLSDDFRT